MMVQGFSGLTSPNSSEALEIRFSVMVKGDEG